MHLESGIEQRAEEPEALQVIEMQVRQHDVQLAIVTVDVHTERTHPGARVEHEPVAAVEHHLDAARVAAVADGVGAGCRQTAATAPDLRPHDGAPSWLFSCQNTVTTPCSSSAAPTSGYAVACT